MPGYDYVSAVIGCTTAVSGRFALRGQSYELVTDGSIASGGPGRAPGPLDLLVSALVTNMLNVLRGAGDLAPEPADERIVQVRARTSRYTPDRLKAGRLTIDVIVDGLDEDDTEILLEQYRLGCRVLPAVETVLDVRLKAVSSADVAA